MFSEHKCKQALPNVNIDIILPFQMLIFFSSFKFQCISGLYQVDMIFAFGIKC